MINLANNNELSAIGASATSLRKLENGGMRLDNACSIQTNNTQPAIAADGDYFWFIRFRLRALINTNHTVFGNRLGGTSSPLQFVKFYESGFSYYNNATGPTMTYPRAAEAEKSTKWESIGDGSFTIEEATKESRGTTITLKLKCHPKKIRLPG